MAMVGIMAKVHDRKNSYLSIIRALRFLLLSSSPEIAGWRRAGLLLRGSCWGLVFICGLTELCRLDKVRVFTTTGCGVFGFGGSFGVVRGVRETSVPFGRLGICGGGCWLLSISPFSFLMSITSGCGSASSSSTAGGFAWPCPPHLQGMGKGIGIGIGIGMGMRRGKGRRRVGGGRRG